MLGHERCGAVKAATGAVLEGEHVIGHIGSVAAAIVPAVETARSRPGDLLDNAVRANVALVVALLRASEPILADRVCRGTLRVVGAHYGLHDGIVEVIVP